ncbi:MAG TPA: sigma-70 family RNA polymerase sigma factor [Luteolibacter sp.]|nr:sigma-70 family RNA polymerase sigma factor [Luteolibacter sp.]
MEPAHSSPETTSREAEFTALLVRHEHALASYVFGLVPATADAEDILQLSRLQMWKLFDRYEAGTNFLAWARKIAFYQMLNFRRADRARYLAVDPATLESIADAVADLSPPEEFHCSALEICMRKLPLDHRRLIVQRYSEDADIPSLAKRIGSTAGAVYRALSRIRINLLACMKGEVSAPEA